MMDPKIIDKVLSKSATPDEARRVAAWFATDEGQEYFSKRYERESYLLNEMIISEWLDNEIPTGKMKVRFSSQLKMRIRTFRFRVAAAVLIPLVFLAGAFALVASRTGVFSGEDLADISVPFGEQMQVILQDGTVVQLNSGSHLQYPKSFGLFSRKVKLTGEAFFSVAKDHGRPFIVNLNDVDIKVTGTKFNVKAYPVDNKITVSLEEGSVNIADEYNKIYPLKVGESAVYNRNSGVCSINKVEDMTLHTAWRTKSLNFYRTPLKDILKTLERQYDVRFEVGDSALLNYRFSISTNRVNIREILSDLEKVSKIKFHSENQNNFEVSVLKQ